MACESLCRRIVCRIPCALFPEIVEHGNQFLRLCSVALFDDQHVILDDTEKVLSETGGFWVFAQILNPLRRVSGVSYPEHG